MSRLMNSQLANYQTIPNQPTFQDFKNLLNTYPFYTYPTETETLQHWSWRSFVSINTRTAKGLFSNASRECEAVIEKQLV